MGFDKGIDNISHHYALQWVLIRNSIIFLIVMPCAMGFYEDIYDIPHRKALRWVFIRELIIFIIVMPYDGF